MEVTFNLLRTKSQSFVLGLGGEAPIPRSGGSPALRGTQVRVTLTR
jgi:hypothetical protein